MKQSHGEKYNGDRESHTHLQAGLATGYLCRRTEEELHAIATASGGIVPADELAHWLGKFFLSQSQKGWELLDNRKRVSQVRGKASERYALPASTAAVHVHARHHLSLAARKRIAKAQRDRWAKVHKKQGKKTKSSGIARYWSGMTAEERSAEVIRRKKVAMAKAA